MADYDQVIAEIANAIVNSAIAREPTVDRLLLRKVKTNETIVPTNRLRHNVEDALCKVMKDLNEAVGRKVELN